jgi:hypothetical protein
VVSGTGNPLPPPGARVRGSPAFAFAPLEGRAIPRRMRRPPRWGVSAAVATAMAVTGMAGLSPLACEKKSDGGASAESDKTTPVTLGPAGARVTVGEHGFSPASFVVGKGAPGSTAPLTFVRTTDQTCAKEVVFPDLGVQKDLPLDTPVTIDLPTGAARTLVFQCGMAMYKGALVVR